MTTTTFFGSLSHTSCCQCGATFGMESHYLTNLRNTLGKTHWCPYCGTAQSFRGETETARLKRDKEYLEARLQSARDEAESQRKARKAVERKLSATKGVVTRTKRRVAHGVCPCCSRTFRQLAAHMTDKHPEYVATATESVGARS